MSLLVVGLNHRTAPTSLLELAAISPDDAPKVLHDLVRSQHVGEAVVLSTCNRTEIYADVETFHGGVAEISDQLTRITGVQLSDLSSHLYVHHEARAVGHLFSVVCGLDSMLVGETQILGQVRGAFRLARDSAGAAATLVNLFQAALRVGKRAHTETSIDMAGASIVSVGVRLAASSLTVRSNQLARAVGGGGGGDLGLDPSTDTGHAADTDTDSDTHFGTGPGLAPLAGARVLIVGAGAVGSLAAATVRKAGAGQVVVANRTTERAVVVAENYGARVAGLAELAHEMSVADLVVSSTGATGIMVGRDDVAAAVAARGGTPLVFLDLALPHDIDPSVRDLPGVTLIDLDALRTALDGHQVARDVEAVRALVAGEVAAFIDRRRAQGVAPTVVALRAQAAAVVQDEMDRLRGRLPGLGTREWTAVEQTVRRVVDKLLHAPTVRVQELAEAPGGHSYAEALRELFDLPREVPAMVSAPDLVERS